MRTPFGAATSTWRRDVRGPLPVHQLDSLRECGVDAFLTDRRGGVSEGPYGSLNLGRHVGDESDRVQENRRRVASAAGVDPARLAIVNQIHGAEVVDVDESWDTSSGDALLLSTTGVAAAVLVADCVPMVLVAPDAHRLCVVHAGWRGLVAGVLDAALTALKSDPVHVVVGVGPTISPARYQVGPEVAEHFADVPGALLTDHGDRSRLDLLAVVAHQLSVAGVDPANVDVINEHTDGGDLFFSDRATRPCGRFALVATWSS